MEANELKKHEIAKERAKKKVGFLRHLIAFLIVNAICAFINNITNTGGVQWWLWITLFWGIALVIHFIISFITRGFSSLENKLVKKELEREGVNYQEDKATQIDLPIESWKTVKVQLRDENEDQVHLIETLKNKAKKRIIFGLIWIVIGLIITIVYLSIGSLRKVGIFNLVTIVGIVLLIIGAINNSKANKLRIKLLQHKYHTDSI